MFSVNPQIIADLQKVAAYGVVIKKSENSVFIYDKCRLWCEENIGEKDFWPSSSEDMTVPETISGRAWTWYYNQEGAITFYFTNVEDAIHFKMRWL
jgi:hypothetical protein